MHPPEMTQPAVQVVRTRQRPKDLRSEYEMTFDRRIGQLFPAGLSAFVETLPEDALAVDCSRCVPLRSYFDARLAPVPPH